MTVAFPFLAALAGVIVGSLVYQAGYLMGRRAGRIDARLESADVFEAYIENASEFDRYTAGKKARSRGVPDERS